MARMRMRMQLSTGLPKLDHVFRGLMAGDNVVWQVDSIDDYLPFVEPYVARALEIRQTLPHEFYDILYRSAHHVLLVKPLQFASIK